MTGRISKRGFTLIELLIVIGILAILATTVVLVLNPAQILQESRDTQRIADLRSITEAIALAGIANPQGFTTTAAQCTVSGSCNPFSGGTCTGGAGTCTVVTSRAVTGTGWVAFNFGTNPTMSVLPIDPTNTACTATAGFCYASKASITGPSAPFELNAHLESAKYSGLMATDGGSNNNFYEVGTALNL